MDRPLSLRVAISLLELGGRTDLCPSLVPFATVRARPARVRSMSISRFHSSIIATDVVRFKELRDKDLSD